MAIPLRKLTSPDSKFHPQRPSLDSQTSAILSYALGNHPDKTEISDDEDEDNPNSTRASTTLDDEEDEEAFFKENDPLTSDYDPFPQKRVFPSLLIKLTRRNHGDFVYVFLLL